MSVPKVTIYTTHTCPFCKMAKAFLTDQGVAYTEIFVDDDEANKNAMINLSGQMGTPVTLVEYDDGEKRQFVGFNQVKLQELTEGKKTGEPLVQEI